MDRPSIWLVDDDEPFREVAQSIADDAGVRLLCITPAELSAEETADLPQGAFLDGALLDSSAARYLANISRLVICTARDFREIPEPWSRHPNVRVLLKPFDLPRFEGALRWLAGDEGVTPWEDVERRTS